MSAAAFQTALASLIAGVPAGAPTFSQLSKREQARYAALTQQAGVLTMRMLYFSWRLTKVLSLLPLTTRALGDEETAARLRRFWSSERATSYYFVDEVLGFARRLESDLPARVELQIRQILGFETARLELRRRHARGEPPGTETVPCDFDFTALLAAIEQGGDLSIVPRTSAVLKGCLTAAGEEAWTLSHPSPGRHGEGLTDRAQGFNEWR